MRDNLKAMALVGAATASVQLGAAFAKSLFAVVDPMNVISLRLLFSSIVLACVLKIWRADLRRRNWRDLAMLGVTLGLMNTCFYFALDRLPLGVAVSLETLGPITLALILSRRAEDLVWAGFAVAGLALLFPRAEAQEWLDLVGVFFGLSSGFFWALYIVVGRRARLAHGPETATLAIIIACIAFAPWGLSGTAPVFASVELLLIALAAALLSTAAPIVLDMIALQRVSARVFGLFMSLKPAMAALAGFFILGELLSLEESVAMLLISTALIGVAFKRQPS